MRRNWQHPLLALVGSLFAMAPIALSQGVTLQEQLNAQYKLARMGSDSGGLSVVDPGRCCRYKRTESSASRGRRWRYVRRNFRTTACTRP